MKIISPIDNLAEADQLLQAGADELYGGFVPSDWQKNFGRLASINQRTFGEAQIRNLAELSTIVAKAHERRCTFSLTLNAPFYDDAMIPYLLKYVDQAANAGIDGIILADLGLLRLLRRRHPQIEYHASTLARLGNSEAVKFYREQGIRRTILPRHLPVGEMQEIIARVPGMRFDAFMLVGKCPNTEGLCTFHHASPDKIWPCEIPYTLTPEQPPASARLERVIARQASWSQTNRRHGCGLCAVPSLTRSGVCGLKLVGRGAPSMQKVKNLLLVRDFVELAGQCDDFADYRRRARRAHRERFGADCSPNVCYYPEFYEAE